MNKRLLKHFDFAIVDLLCLVVTFYAALYIRFKTFELNDVFQELFIVEILINIILLFLVEPYKNILKLNNYKMLSRTIVYVYLQGLISNIMLYVFHQGGLVSRLFFGIHYVLYFFISYLCRYLLKKRILKESKDAIRTGNNVLLVVTDKKHINQTITAITEENFEFNRIAGLCIIDEDRQGETISGFNVVANLDNLLSYVCINQIDGVFINMNYQNVPEEVLNGLAIAGITVHIRLRKVSSLIGQEQHFSKLFNYSVLTSQVKEISNRQKFLKRTMDIMGGIVGSLITLVLIIIIGPIIYIKSPGPIFYKQERIGLNGRHFKMIKFRSMIMNADQKLEELKKYNRVSSDFMFKMENDPRIIPGIGNFIRKTSLDEFPQFFNVLKGDMSLVGTRPPTVQEFEKYELKHRIRMSTKPGITGMWQTSGRNEITDFNEVVKLDAWYINNWTLSLDIELLFKTVKQLLNHKDDEVM